MNGSYKRKYQKLFKALIMYNTGHIPTIYNDIRKQDTCIYCINLTRAGLTWYNVDEPIFVLVAWNLAILMRQREAFGNLL